MADIKTKQSKKGTIKTLDKNVIQVQKFKDKLISAKDKTKETYENNYNSGTEYAINEISKQADSMPNNIYKVNKVGKNNFQQTRENLTKVQENIKNLKRKSKIKQRVKNITKIRKNTTKATRATIKTANKTIKGTEKTAKATINTSKKAVQVAKTTAKATGRAIQATVKATIATIKAIILASKALISAIIAGGWVAIFIIIIICLIGLICTSVFGIFFSSEKEVNGKTMSSVVSEINIEFTNKITDIQNNTEHDDYEINSNRAEWKDVISIYAVEIGNGEEQTDVITLDDKKVEKLKEIFWKMNTISSKVEEIEKDIEIIDENGNTKTEKQKRKVLYIDVTSKTIEEMAKEYNFNKKQKEQLAELRKKEYASMWNNVIYGSSIGSQDIVQVAKQQIGNVGGQPYWSWYGFTSRVEWCACFVSWCANECGYIEAGIIPKFASVNVEGVPWFKTCGVWKESGYNPKAGDIIFFDWDNDAESDHTGIVEKVENGTVYTIEGNTSGDSCKQKEYSINSNVILGYGTPIYN